MMRGGLNIMEKDIYLDQGRVKGQVKNAIKSIHSGLSLDIIAYTTELDYSFLKELADHPQISLESALDLYYSKY
jgi:hypothetical protein